LVILFQHRYRRVVNNWCRYVTHLTREPSYAWRPGAPPPRRQRLWQIVAATAAGLGVVLAAIGAEAQTGDPVDRFNFVLGTQTFGAAYRFSAEAPVVETARAVLALGSNTIKFKLASATAGAQPLVEIARNDPAIKTVIDMPFFNQFMWVYPPAPRARVFAPDTLATEYREIYDLTRYLLQTYSGTGKVFFLGNWEMDNHLTASRKREPSPELLANVIAWVNTRQQAVDDAKGDTPHSQVEVYYYLEVNLVWDAIAGKPRAANIVLPATHVDYVSYSAYDSLLPYPERKLPRALDYLEGQLRPKEGILGKRVFIGEYGFPADHYAPQDQDALSRRVMRTSLAWGCPFVLYWEMYNNEVRDGHQRGFWLIDDKGRKQPVYFTLQQYYVNAHNWVTAFLHRRQRLPSPSEFDTAATEWLK
jgi:hypothetical protein